MGVQLSFNQSWALTWTILFNSRLVGPRLALFGVVGFSLYAVCMRDNMF